MPDVKVSIGDREFEVACQSGEEHFLKAAAAMLNAEAQVLSNQIGRLPESRMLLMAGLMLADKTAGIDEQLRGLEQKLAAQEDLIAELRARPEETTRTIEVATVPQEMRDRLAALANRAEDLAEAVEARAAS